MEKLTSLSKLTIPESAAVHGIDDTTVSCRERYRASVPLTTSVETSRDTFTFSILPNLPSELDVRGSYLVVKMKVMKGDPPKEYTTSDQISCSQALGVLAWDSCKVSKTRL